MQIAVGSSPRGPSPTKKEELAAHTYTAAKWALDLIRPSITTKSRPHKHIRRTAYLDGLRGFAAFLVYIQHHQLWPLRMVPANRILENGWGYEDRYYFATLPIVRTFFTGGHFAVAVFFIVSGYVLSSKPLSLIYSGEFDRLVDNLSAALFKRWIRLHLPIILVSFLYMSSWHLFGIWTLSPDQKSNYRDELWNWYIEFKNFSFVFRTGGNAWFTYNFPTWSIPVEFRGSVVIYTCLLAFSRATRNARLLCQAGLIFYFLYIVDGWFGAMFVAGMMLCELDILARNDDLPFFIARLSPYKTAIFYSLLVVAAFWSGVPSHVADVVILKDAPGWNHLAFLKPEAMWDHKWWFLFWSSVFLVAAIPRIWWLKAFFETSFNQYLGRISFALYLVHGPIIWTLGDRLYAAVGWYKTAHETYIPGWVNIFPLNKNGPLGLEMAFFGPQLILLPLTLWCAEVATKLFDEPSVKLAQWLYNKVSANPPPSSYELHASLGPA